MTHIKHLLLTLQMATLVFIGTLTAHIDQALAYTDMTSKPALHENESIAEPTPLMDKSISFDLYSASFFKEQENILSLGDTYEIFKNLKFPNTLLEQDDQVARFRFRGLTLSFAKSTSNLCFNSLARPLIDSDVLTAIELTPEYQHRVILVLPASGSILELSLASGEGKTGSTESLGILLKKAKALFEKEFSETKTKVLTSQIYNASPNQLTYELIFQSTSTNQRVIMTADTQRGNLNLKVETLSKML